MGGGSSSQTSLSIAQKSVVNAMTQSIMNCSGSGMMSQTVSVPGSFNVVNVKQVQIFSLSSSCANSAANVADIQTTVSNAIEQASSSQSVSVLGALGSSSSNSNTSISTEVSANITNQTISNIINTVTATQNALVSGNNNIVTVDQEQTMTIVSQSCLTALNNLSSFTALANDAKQTSTATQTNFISDIVSSIFDGLASLGALWVIIIVCGLGIGAWVLINGGPVAAFFGKNNSAAPPGQPNMQTYNQQPNMQTYNQRPNMQTYNQQVNPQLYSPPMQFGQPLAQLPPNAALAQQYGTVK
jgi:hypothetical protein